MMYWFSVATLSMGLFSHPAFSNSTPAPTGMLSSTREGEIFCVRLAKKEPAPFDGFFTGGSKVDFEVSEGEIASQRNDGVFCRKWHPGDCINKGGCDVCEGSCTNDSSCRGHLRCWFRTKVTGTGPQPGIPGKERTDYPWDHPDRHMGVPGCIGTPADGANYCYDPYWDKDLNVDQDPEGPMDCDSENAEQCTDGCNVCWLAREMDPNGICSWDGGMKNGLCQICWGCVEGFYASRYLGRNCWDYEDTCWADHCTNGKIDYGEEQADCGGTCGQECWPGCEDDSEWRSEYGTCPSYATSNKAYCGVDRGSDGRLASEACPKSCQTCGDLGYVFWTDVDGSAPVEVTPSPTPPPSTPCPSPAPEYTFEPMIVNDWQTGLPKDFYCQDFGLISETSNVAGCEAACSGDSECRFYSVGRTEAVCRTFSACFGKDHEEGMTLVDVFERTEIGTSSPCGDLGSAPSEPPTTTVPPPSQDPTDPPVNPPVCTTGNKFVEMSLNTLKHTCDKAHLLKKECSKNCTVDQCKQKCEQSDECAYFGLSNNGICKTFKSCDKTSSTGREWETYARSCDDSLILTGEPTGTPTSPPATGEPSPSPTPEPTKAPTPPPSSPPTDLPAPTPTSGGDSPCIGFEKVDLVGKATCHKNGLIRKACKNCDAATCQEKCEDDANCMYYTFLSNGGVCKTYSDCTQTGTSKIFDVYRKSSCGTGQAPTPMPVEVTDPPSNPPTNPATPTPTETPTSPPTNPPTPKPTLSPTTPTTDPPANPPTNGSGFVKLTFTTNKHTCDKKQLLKKECGKGCDYEHCAGKCEENDACKFFSLSNTGICKTYKSCTKVTSSSNVVDTYEKQ